MNEKFLGDVSPDRERDKIEERKKDTEPTYREDNTDKKEIDTLHANVLLETHKQHIDELKQQESIDTRRQIDSLKGNISPRMIPTPQASYESMSDDEIELIANQGRNESVHHVKSMIDTTSWIPDILKRNA